jgi:hypothetical protein
VSSSVVKVGESCGGREVAGLYRDRWLADHSALFVKQNHGTGTTTTNGGRERGVLR